MHSIPVFKRKSLVQRAWFDVMRNWQLYLLILIPLAILILFKYAPMYGVQIAFRDFKNHPIHHERNVGGAGVFYEIF